jgi:hypothetical protein
MKPVADHVLVANTLTGGRARVVGLNDNNANNNRPPPRVGD